MERCPSLSTKSISSVLLFILFAGNVQSYTIPVPSPTAAQSEYSTQSLNQLKRLLDLASHSANNIFNDFCLEWFGEDGCLRLRQHAQNDTRFPNFSDTETNSTSDLLREMFSVTYQYMIMIGQFEADVMDQNVMYAPSSNLYLSLNTFRNVDLESVAYCIRNLVPDVQTPSSLPTALNFPDPTLRNSQNLQILARAGFELEEMSKALDAYL